MVPVTRTNETLASSVSISTPDGVVRGRDIKVFVSPRSVGLTVSVRVSDTTVAINLDLGERIALIEALGGHP